MQGTRHVRAVSFSVSKLQGTFCRLQSNKCTALQLIHDALLLTLPKHCPQGGGHNTSSLHLGHVIITTFNTITITITITISTISTVVLSVLSLSL
jgi:hypothetical protein